mmetsp:Transcript_15954/g.34955  ORF Transcript_15954/g.34955 Transcript_15954/m.34955 type:complete len:201 (-) Transcript_15954:252-854(-)
MVPAACWMEADKLRALWACSPRSACNSSKPSRSSAIPSASRMGSLDEVNAARLRERYLSSCWKSLARRSQESCIADSTARPVMELKSCSSGCFVDVKSGLWSHPPGREARGGDSAKEVEVTSSVPQRAVGRRDRPTSVSAFSPPMSSLLEGHEGEGCIVGGGVSSISRKLTALLLLLLLWLWLLLVWLLLLWKLWMLSCG